MRLPITCVVLSSVLTSLGAQTALFSSSTDTIAVLGDTPSIGTAYTAEAFLMPGVGLPVTNGIVFQEQYDSIEDKSLIALGGAAGGTCWNTPQPTSFTAPALAGGAWYHVAFVYDGCEQRIYVDGVLLRSRPYSGVVGNTPSSLMTVGAFVEPLGSEFRGAFTGQIDSLRISNVARYSGATFARPVGDLSTDASTVLLYNFNEPAASTTVADLSGNGHTGTLGVGFPTATAPTLGVAGMGAAPQQLVLGAGQAYAASSSAGNLFRTGPGRFQAVYFAGLFTSSGVTGPITINRIRFRGVDGVANVGGQTYPGASVVLSTCPVSYLGLSTTFVSNQTAPVTVFGPATIQVGASSGTIPNSWSVDIPLATPYTYNPTLGSDLNIEVIMPVAPVAPTAPPTPLLTGFATSISVPAAGANCVTSAVAAAATGALSNFAPVVQVEFAGPGGFANAVGARTRSYGAGCYRTATSFYQEIPVGDRFDLADKCDATRGLTMTPVSGGNYLVTAGAGAVVPPTGLPLSNGDDVNVPIGLPFTFGYPGGATAAITACTNGYVFVGGPAVGADWTPTVGEFLSQPARFAPLWRDLHAGTNLAVDPTAGLYYSVDTSNPSDTVALVTWSGMGDFSNGAAGHYGSTMQLALHSTGVVEFRYSKMSATLSGLVGFSRGILAGFPASDPGSRDLSNEVPFTTNGPDGPGSPLTLTSGRPVIGTTVLLATSAIPPTTTFIFDFVSLTPIPVGIDLGFVGAPGCLGSILLPELLSFAFAGGAFLPVYPPQPTLAGLINTFFLPIPPTAAFVGAEVYWQSAALVFGVNPFGVLTSNAVHWTLGLP